MVGFLGGSPDQITTVTRRPRPTCGPGAVSVVGGDDDIVPAEYWIELTHPGAIEVVPIVGADPFRPDRPAQRRLDRRHRRARKRAGTRNPSEVDRRGATPRPWRSSPRWVVPGVLPHQQHGTLRREPWWRMSAGIAATSPAFIDHCRFGGRCAGPRCPSISSLSCTNHSTRSFPWITGMCTPRSSGKQAVRRPTLPTDSTSRPSATNRRTD